MELREEKRVKEVQKYLRLDFEKLSELQNIVDIAAQLCEKPVALITLLDEECNWLKVRSGVDIEVMPRATSFCQYTIQTRDLLIIPDAAKDARFDNNPLVHENPKVRFYAGVPLILSNGLELGSLCLFDLKPNNINALQQKVLTLLGRHAASFMELEVSRKELRNQIEEKDAKNESLRKIAQLQSHQIRQPLTTIMGLVNLIKDGYQGVDEDWIKWFNTATADFDKKIQEIVAETMASKDLKAIRFTKMVEEIDDCAILLLDRDGYIENWNKGAQKIKGYNSAEIIGKHFSIFYTDYDKKENRPKHLIDKSVQYGAARDEGWRVRKDGSRFWGSIVITAIHDNAENVIGFTKLTRDLTDITNTRESLTAYEDLYQYLLEQTNKVARVGGWELDIPTNTLSWTSITREIHGVGADYVPSLANAINFYKEGADRNSISLVVKQAIEEGKDWDIELQMVTKQGKEIWVRATGRSNFKDGICTKVYGTLQDIDARKSRETSINKHGEAVKSVLDSVSEVGIITTDAEGTITLFNAGAEKMLGYAANEVTGRLNFCSFHPVAEIKQRAFELTKEYGFNVDGFQAFTQKVKTATVEQRLCTCKRKDGTETKVSLIASAIRNAENNITGYLFVGTAV